MNYDGYYDRLVSLYNEYGEFDRSKIPLCAAENYVSPFVKQGLISKYEGKYISGYINRDREKDFIGSDYLEKILLLANDMAAELFGAKYNDFRSLTGMNTVALILMTLIDKETKILITDPQSGGHGSLPKLCTNLGVRYESIPYDYSLMQIDYDKLNYILAHDDTISFLFFCQSDVIQPPELKLIKLPPRVGIIYDATQTLGLIAGKVLPNPLSVCDNIIIIGGTHKTFPSVTCGYVATNNDGYIQKVNQNISPNFLRNVQINNITSVCLTMLEMLKFGTDYARKIVYVANDLGAALNEYGIPVKHTTDGRFSHTHQLFIEHPLDKVDFTYSQFRNYYNRFLGWSMEFGLASIERKRIIISQLYKRIELGRGYVINFEVDWNYEQFIDTLVVQQHKGLTAVGVPLPPKARKGRKKAAKQKQGVA